MNQETIANRIKENYGTIAADYRRADELDVMGQDHQYVCKMLGMLSGSFGRPITVLDLGCGAGRYFHSLNNTERLVGLDVCAEMLEEARHPVKMEKVSIGNIELICGGAHSQCFPAESFDLIYSIGMFGNGCGLSTELLSKLYHWLAYGGALFFDAFDKSGIPVSLRMRRQISNYVCQSPALNQVRNAVRKGSGELLPFYYYSKGEIIALLECCGFSGVEVYPQDCQTPTGPGRKLQCLAFKRAQNYTRFVKNAN